LIEEKEQFAIVTRLLHDGTIAHMEGKSNKPQATSRYSVVGAMWREIQTSPKLPDSAV